MSKCLVAPLNWGLGHASRCVPLIQRLLNEGHEVILGGDGESLTLLRHHFPKLRYTYLAPLNLRYGSGKRQVWAILKALPQLLIWSIKDHTILQSILREEPIDQVISDNRFGLYTHQTECVYITHQLHIMLPNGWHWAEGIASRLHARIYRRYNKVWVPDYAEPEKSLAGELSHNSTDVEYIGPLSRFQNLRNIPNLPNNTNYDIAAVLSGLEPQRTILEKEIIARYTGTDKRVLIVQGLMHRPNTRIKRGSITIVPHSTDEELVPALLGANRIIARSGYSTIMDLHALGLLSNSPKDGLTAKRSNSETVYQCNGPLVELHPTPGQPEQEYLATLHNKMQ